MAALKYGRIEVYFDQVLGAGAYGEVCRAKCGMLPCAAKALHSVLFSYQDPGESTILKKFDEECQFLSSIKHPNIIQYLGTTVDEKSGRHVLLMELMDESLTRLLERSKQNNSQISYRLQISICCDVTLALTYLHSNDIIHRDLSSNNVLLIAGERAKVADFGVSTIFDKKMNHLTTCPGSKVYMPPEAQTEPPDYTNKLDCFSLGVLVIQIATLNFPDPRPLYRVVHNTEYASGVIQVFVPEKERRENHICLVAEDHPLLPMALDCLEQSANRPSAQKLCEKFLEMKAQRSTEDLSCCKGSEDDKSSQSVFIETLLQELEKKTQLLEDLEKEVRIGESAPTVVDSGEAAATESVSGETERDSKEIDSTKDSGEVFVDSVPGVKDIRTTGWIYEPGPDSFSAYDGSCVFDTEQAYFSKKSKLYCYQYGNCCENGCWSQLVNTTYQYCGLALINRHIVTISGWKGLKLSDSLLTLHGGISWKVDLPPIPTSREAPACISTPTHLVVLGGVVNLLTATSCCVEVLNLGNRQWSTAICIPELRTP